MINQIKKNITDSIDIWKIIIYRILQQQYPNFNHNDISQEKINKAFNSFLNFYDYANIEILNNYKKFSQELRDKTDEQLTEIFEKLEAEDKELDSNFKEYEKYNEACGLFAFAYYPNVFDQPIWHFSKLIETVYRYHTTPSLSSKNCALLL